MKTNNQNLADSKPADSVLTSGEKVRAGINGEILPHIGALLPRHNGDVADQSSRTSMLAKGERSGEFARKWETVEKLAGLDPFEYDQQRLQVANELDVRASTLDKLVADKRKKNKADSEIQPFTVAEPWPEPVDGASLVEDLTTAFHSILFLPTGGYLVSALWTLHTHCFGAFIYTPILNFTSPLKRCGKSLALDFLKHLCARAIKFDMPTAPVLFRLTEEYRPTSLIDEWDSLAGKDTQIAVRGILNSGFHRNGCVPRCAAGNQETRFFSTFGPKAVSGIGALPDTAQDRAITIQTRPATTTITLPPAAHCHQSGCTAAMSGCTKITF